MRLIFFVFIYLIVVLPCFSQNSFVDLKKIFQKEPVKLNVIFQKNKRLTLSANVCSIVQFWQEDIAYSDFIQNLDTSRQDQNMAQIQKILLEYEFQCLYSQPTIKELKTLIDLNIPVILSSSEPDAYESIALQSYHQESDRYIILNPLLGEEKISKKELRSLYKEGGREALLIFPVEMSWLELLLEHKLPVQDWIYSNSKSLINK